MLEGYFMGIVIVFLGVSVGLNIYLLLKEGARRLIDGYLLNRLRKSIKEGHKSSDELGTYRDLVDEYFSRTRIVIGGFERCPNPSMVRPKETTCEEKSNERD